MNIYQPWEGVNTVLQMKEGEVKPRCFSFKHKSVNWAEVDVINGHLSRPCLNQGVYVTAMAEKDLYVWRASHDGPCCRGFWWASGCVSVGAAALNLFAKIMRNSHRRRCAASVKMTLLRLEVTKKKRKEKKSQRLQRPFGFHTRNIFSTPLPLTCCCGSHACQI